MIGNNWVGYKLMADMVNTSKYYYKFKYQTLTPAKVGYMKAVKLKLNPTKLIKDNRPTLINTYQTYSFKINKKYLKWHYDYQPNK